MRKLTTACMMGVVFVSLLMIWHGIADSINQRSVAETPVQMTQKVLISVQQTQTTDTPAILRNCSDFLRERLKANNREYTLVVKSFFDPADPTSHPEMKNFNGSGDAEVLVKFPDDAEVSLYFYGATWEGCSVLSSVPLNTK
ncbi:MAG: hypothetical protein R3E39_20235 [Anaerolineae bacterium]